MIRALVLSGGGAKGAYQVGALKHLLRSAGGAYNILCGVSVGALNAASLAMYPVGQEDIAYRSLEDLWHGLDTSKVYKKWWGGEIAALWKSSVYDSSPLQALVRSRLDLVKVRTSGRKLRVGAVALGSGAYKVFGEDHPNLVNAVLASSAFPAMLTPIAMEDDLWIDGGVREVTPLQAAIDLGAESCDVVMCSPEESPETFSQATTLKVAARAIDIMTDQIIADDLKVTQLYNSLVSAGAAPAKRTVNVRVIRPDKPLIDNSLDFNPAKIREMIRQGYEDAAWVVG